jgi:hypothetical protein
MHPSIQSAVANLGSMGNAMSGGAKGRTGGATRLLYVLLWSLISLSISGVIVQWAYNEVMPTIYASVSDKPFVPLTWTDAMIFVLLTHALIW